MRAWMLGKRGGDFRRLYPRFPKLLWLDSSKLEKGLSRFSIFGMSSPERGYTLHYKVDSKILEKKWEQGRTEYFQKVFSTISRQERKLESERGTAL